MFSNGEYCPRCAERGAQSIIKVIKVQDSLPLKFCSDQNCFYPLDLDDSDVPSSSTPGITEMIQEISDDSNSSVIGINHCEKEGDFTNNNFTEEFDARVSDRNSFDVLLRAQNNDCLMIETKSDSSVEEMFTEINDCEDNSGQSQKESEENRPNLVECISDAVLNAQNKVALKSDSSVEETFTEINDCEDSSGRDRKETEENRSSLFECISDAVLNAQNKVALKSDSSVQEILTEINDCEDSSGRDRKETEENRSSLVECTSDAVLNAQNEVALKSDSSVEEILTENDCEDNLKCNHIKTGGRSQNFFEFISSVLNNTEIRASEIGDERNPEVVEVVQSSQEAVCIDSQEDELNTNKDVLIDLTSGQSQEQKSNDLSCHQTFEESYETLQKVLNMCTSDEDESSIENMELGSSTASENSSTASLSDTLPICPQWKNKNNMCWLDSTLSLLLMSPLRSLVLKMLKEKSAGRKARGSSKWLDSLLHDTFKEYQRVMRRVERLQSFVSSPDLSDSAKLSYRRLKARMERIRTHSMEYLQEHCNVGHDENGDSPIFALSALLKKKSSMRPLFDSATKYNIECSSCRFQCWLSRDNPIVCLVKRPPSDFQFNEEGFTLENETCDNCQKGEEKRRVHWARLNRFLLVQFCHGLADDHTVDEWCQRLTFEAKGARYSPIGVVQYKTLSRNAKHFVAWIRAPEHNVWLEADDMNERFCLFDKKSLAFQASEVHLILFMAQPSDVAIAPSFPLTFEMVLTTSTSIATSTSTSTSTSASISTSTSTSASTSANTSISTSTSASTSTSTSASTSTRVKPNESVSLCANDSASTSSEAETEMDLRTAEAATLSPKLDAHCVKDRPRGSRGISFASIASEHVPKVKANLPSKRESSEPNVGGVILKRLRVSLQRCDNF